MECAPAPNEPSNQEKADTTLARELQADEYNKTQPEDTTFPFLDLPEELQRRCLRHVSIANLLVNVFRVNKYLSIAAVQEVRERVQGQIQDALISGFDSDAAAAAEKAAEERFAAAENDGGSPSSSAGASSSRSPRPRHVHWPRLDGERGDVGMVAETPRGCPERGGARREQQRKRGGERP